VSRLVRGIATCDVVDSLGLNGPSGGSIAAIGVREVLGVVSTFVPRELVRPSVSVEHVSI
jgi:hypothetical protein